MSEPTRRFTLRDLPFAARLTLAAFLISVGLGYFAALVQLHVQQASPGQLLPGSEEVVAAYHGKPGQSVLERLIATPETAPFTSSGSMRAAFTTQSGGWRAAMAKVAGDPHAQAQLRKERDGEAAALVHWITEGKLDKKAYDDDSYPLPESMKDTPITPRFVEEDAAGKKEVHVKSIIDTRCGKCHVEGRQAGFAPLDSYELVQSYAHPEQGGMPLRKLAQSTHVHLLGFSMLYMLTGVIFACSSWPGIFRFVIAPLPLVAQVVDISFWWLARLQDPYGSEFARCIRYSGMVVAAGLGLQIILGLFSLFGWPGRVLLLLAIAAAAVGAYYLNDMYIAPYLAQQAKLSGL